MIIKKNNLVLLTAYKYHLDSGTPRFFSLFIPFQGWRGRAQRWIAKASPKPFRLFIFKNRVERLPSCRFSLRPT